MRLAPASVFGEQVRGEWQKTEGRIRGQRPSQARQNRRAAARLPAGSGTPGAGWSITPWPRTARSPTASTASATASSWK